MDETEVNTLAELLWKREARYADSLWDESPEVRDGFRDDAKFILGSDWFTRVVDTNRFVGKADAMANVLNPKGPIWTRMHADGWDEGYERAADTCPYSAPHHAAHGNPYRVTP